VISTWNNGKTDPGSAAYATMAGTSMAAPHVSGVVSLMYSYNPRLIPAQIMEAIQSGATPFPEGSTCTTSTCGSGILNMAEALNHIISTSVDLISFNVNTRTKANVIKWTTATETNNLGFNLYRSRTKDGKKIKINKDLISTLVPPGSPFGADYRYRDGGARPGVRYFYWLEDVDLDGQTQMYGPVKVRVPILATEIH
jgi:subtilisin family serine protease